MIFLDFKQKLRKEDEFRIGDRISRKFVPRGDTPPGEGGGRISCDTGIENVKP